MVPLSALTIATDDERLSCGGFSLGKMIHFGSLEFIADRFGGLSLSCTWESSDAIAMDSTHGGPPSPQQAMTRHPIEGSSMASNEEGRINFPPPKRRSMATTTLRPEKPPTIQATMTIPPRQEMS
jgi:hypothetical protein